MAGVNDIRIGGHVDSTDPITQSRAAGFDLAQIFLGDPKGWKAPVVNSHRGNAAALVAAAREADVALVVHSPYVLNVASTNNRIRIPSRKILQQQITLAAEIGAIGIVVHGGHVTAADDPARGYDNWRKCIEGLDLAVPVFIENTAGGENAMARGLDNIARLWEAISSASGFESVGFCLDTCHAHASGEELVGLTERVRAITGRLDLIHLNDSRDPAGSGADRHESLGQGFCDPAGLADVARTAGASIVLETPGGPDRHRQDLVWLATQLAKD